MALKVIGAGFGRTGTLSLKLALEALGHKPCHHMMEVFGKDEHIGLWQEAAEGKPTDWDAIFEGYEAAVDWPVCAFWRELSDYYPEAKFILSLRDADKWFDSVTATIFRGLGQFEDDNVHGKMVDTLILRNTFSGNVKDREHAKKVFNDHNQSVIDVLPKDKLLVFEAKDGWAPLCDFLELPVPDIPYPNTNSTEEFQKRFQEKD